MQAVEAIVALDSDTALCDWSGWRVGRYCNHTNYRDRSPRE